jgi:hypothetical protein
MNTNLLPNPQPAGEKLLLVTLALNEACKNGNWPEAGQLLEQRTLAVNDLIASPEPHDPKLLERCSDAGNDLLSCLHGHRREISQEIRKLALWKRAHHLYNTAK